MRSQEADQNLHDEVCGQREKAHGRLALTKHGQDRVIAYNENCLLCWLRWAAGCGLIVIEKCAPTIPNPSRPTHIQAFASFLIMEDHLIPTALVKANVTVVKFIVEFQGLDVLALTNRFIDSQDLMLHQRLWSLRIYPNGIDADSQGYLSCYLRCRSSLLTSGNIAISCSGITKKVEAVDIITPEDHNDSGEIGWSRYLKLSNDNSRCTLEVLTLLVEVDLFGPIRRALLTDNWQEAAQKNAIVHSDRMLSLLQGADFADVMLIVHGERLSAHKCLLCPRSAVFRAMFQHPMKEAATNEVVLGGDGSFDAMTVRAMLCFLYTGSVQESQLEVLAPQLLALACIYQIDDLKIYVEDYCIAKLSEDNVKPIAQCAHQHDCPRLRDHAVAFIAQHGSALVESAGFLDDLSLPLCGDIMRAMAADIAVGCKRKRSSSWHQEDNWGTAVLGETYVPRWQPSFNHH